jgi:hypothetical protein
VKLNANFHLLCQLEKKEKKRKEKKRKEKKRKKRKNTQSGFGQLVDKVIMMIREGVT